MILGTSLAIVVVDMARHLQSMRETTIREGEAPAGSIAKATGEKIGRKKTVHATRAVSRSWT